MKDTSLFHNLKGRQRRKNEKDKLVLPQEK